MNSYFRIDSERVVIASALLVGWAVWTAWRHLILPALIAVGGLVVLAACHLPEPTPVPVVALLPAQVDVVPVITTDPVQIPLRSTQLDTLPSQDLPPAVRQRIRASLDRLSREA
jgi:hypothetical protein